MKSGGYCGLARWSFFSFLVQTIFPAGPLCRCFYCTTSKPAHYNRFLPVSSCAARQRGALVATAERNNFESAVSLVAEPQTTLKNELNTLDRKCLRLKILSAQMFRTRCLHRNQLKKVHARHRYLVTPHLPTLTHCLRFLPILDRGRDGRSSKMTPWVSPG